ncbi:MAG TPA: SIR2 family protein [Chloroflexota bacterium]|nr:SIR2 family protein [Chloroflexota bacterium]
MGQAIPAGGSPVLERAMPSPAIPYGIIAECFRTHTIIPFLGSAASFVGAPADAALPSGKAFAQLLAEKSGYPGPVTDALTKVAQFLEEIPADRTFLLDEVMSRFLLGVPADYQSAFTEFLAHLPVEHMPRLFLTTNYDTLVERTLERRGLPYLAIAHVMRGSKYSGRLVCYDTLDCPLDEAAILPVRRLEEQLLDLETRKPSRIIIYKMHGTALLAGSAGMLDSVVLTENDYIEFLAGDTFQKIPLTIVRALRANRLLFLGYALEDWNFRVLLRRIAMLQQQARAGQHRHWACTLNADDVETKFWERRGVNLYNQSLEVFLDGLSTAIGGHP